MDLDTKTCRRCGETKLLEDFHVRKASSDGRQTYCKVCQLRAVKTPKDVKARRGRLRLEEVRRRESVLRGEALRRGVSTNAIKRCSKCGEFKGVEAFYKHAASPDGRDGYCSICRARQVRISMARRAEPAAAIHLNPEAEPVATPTAILRGCSCGKGFFGGPEADLCPACVKLLEG